MGNSPNEASVDIVGAFMAYNQLPYFDLAAGLCKLVTEGNLTS